MRHTFCLFVGDEFSSLANAMQQYMESVDEQTAKFCHAALLTASEILPLGDEALTNDAESLREWIDTRFNIETSRDDSFTLCVVLPLWATERLDVVNALVARTTKLHSRHKLDFIGLLPDLAETVGFEAQKDGGKTDLKAWQSEEVHRFVVLSEKNQRGQALRFTPEQFAHVLADYFTVCIEAYDSFYPNAEESEKVDVAAIGLSEFYFDKCYFTDYLLRHSYLNVMEREKIHEHAVDSNKVAILAKDNMGDVNIVSDFFKRRVKALLERVGDNDALDERIVNELTPEIEKEGQALQQRLLKCLEDESLSLPEKEGVLAMELGYDDELLSNYLFNETQPSLDDCFTEPIEMILAENNRLPGEKRDEEGNVVQTSERVIDNEFDASLPVANPLPELKKERKDIMDITNYIRHKREEMKGLEKQARDEEASQLRLEGNVFELNGTKYQGENVIYHPLSETYTIPQGVVPKKNVDMRSSFPDVRDQGAQGSCAVFSVVSVYEYIQKKNGKNLDLSERFLYYNARQVSGDDEGTTINAVLQSAGTEGICEESYCRYDANGSQEKPSDDAYNNGLKHKISKALNVNVEHADIVSALSEGYPVVICLQLFASFVNTDHGFVDYPTEEDRKNPLEEHNLHAMVVCGYMEEEQVYIVRNSWGSRFGDKGYCYIPVDYVEDKDLCKGAFIVTEVADKQTLNVRGGQTQAVAGFDKANTAIQYAAIKASVAQQERLLGVKNIKYNVLRTWYERLKQKLQEPSIYKEIENKSQDLQRQQIQSLQNDINTLHHDRIERLDTEKTKRRNGQLKLGLLAAAIAVVWGVCWYCIDDWFTSFGSGLLAASFAVTLLVLAIKTFYDNKFLRRLKDELDQEVETRENDLRSRQRRVRAMPIRLHIAQMFIKHFNDVQLKVSEQYNALKGYVGNLQVWYDEEQKECTEFKELPTSGIFKPILKNDALDEYIAHNADRLIEKVDLCQFLENYNADAETLINIKQQIREAITAKLNDSLKGFSVYRYITGTPYPFLPAQSANVERLLSDMERSSRTFLHTHSDTDEEAIYITLHTANQDEAAKWNSEYRQYFTQRPTAFATSSPYKLLVLRRLYTKQESIVE